MCCLALLVLPTALDIHRNDSAWSRRSIGTMHCASLPTASILLKHCQLLMICGFAARMSFVMH